MDDQRPDPDALLARVQAEEARSARGKLKIFFGAAPGVGKTYTMLEAGRKVAKEGVDVLVGYLEPHVRPETQALLMGLDVLGRRAIEYRGTKLLEFDLEAALDAHPQIMLVDELAHTNAPGVTHTKRWQDIERLLQAGIDVYTTLNVQHLESLNDVIAQITGVIVRETVPDVIFDTADEVELVDLPPDDLIERLREGKIYLPDQASRAIESFFKKGNLIALRELALRRMAERVNAQMQDYRSLHAVVRTWPTSERLMVSVGPSPHSARLVRAARRMAATLRAPWVAVYVETDDSARLSKEDAERAAQTLHLAEELGAETATISGAHLVDELLAYARRRNVTKIVVGKPQRPRWQEWLSGSIVYELTRKCGDIDVYVISGDFEHLPTTRSRASPSRGSPLAYLGALFAVAVCTGGWLADDAPVRRAGQHHHGLLTRRHHGGRAVWPRPVDRGLGLERRRVRFLFRAAPIDVCRLRHAIPGHVRCDAGGRAGHQYVDGARQVSGRIRAQARAAHGGPVFHESRVGRGHHAHGTSGPGHETHQRGIR